MKHVKRTGIYRMISPSNRVYIGQSRDVTNRKSRYRTLKCKNQPKLYASLIKYGFDSHNFTVIVFLPDNISQLDLDKYEGLYIREYKNRGFNMLNLKEAGSFGVHPIESRIKNSNSHKGQIPWNKGLKGSQVAWNKGIHKPLKSYKFILNGEIIIVDDLMVYCKDNKLTYVAMVKLNSGRYNTYKNYKRHGEGSSIGGGRLYRKPSCEKA